MIMSITHRRTFLIALAAAPLFGAGKTKASVIADLGGTIEVSNNLLEGIHRAGFDGFVQDSPGARLKVKPQTYSALPLYGLRAGLPRFEDSMDDAAGEVKTLAELVSVQHGTALILTHAGLSGNGAFRPADLERKARMLELAGAICARHGLTLLYQNQYLEFTGNAAEERALLVRTDPKSVSYLLDADAAVSVGGDAAAFLNANAKRVGGMRVADFNAVPAAALAVAIQKTRWSGCMVVPLSAGTIESYKAARDRIRSTFGV